MTSLVSTAQAGQATAPAYNSTFYAAVVTIIPVLFLPMAVQGNLLIDLLKLAETAVRRIASADRSLLKKITDLLIGYGGLLIAAAIMLYGTYSEVSGLFSLYWQRTVTIGASYASPLIATVFLAVIAAGGPIVAVTKEMTRVRQSRIAVAIVVRETRILLVHADAPEAELFFPGGKVKPGEMAEAAAVRGTFERTGLTVTPRRVLGERLIGSNLVIYVACEHISDIARAVVLTPRKSRWIEWCSKAQRLDNVTWSNFQPLKDYLDT